MASNADTLPIKTGGALREASLPREHRHGALTWVAVTGAGLAVAALALTTIKGGDHDGHVQAPRYDLQAEVHARQAQLEDRGWTIGRPPAATITTNAVGYRAAQLAERKAHLEGQARTIGRQTATTANAPEPVYVPGSRHMPTR